MTDARHGDSSPPLAALPAAQVVLHGACDRCGFDLHGRARGERCPECGTVIEVLGWFNARSLGQIERSARWAKRASFSLCSLPLLLLILLLEDASHARTALALAAVTLLPAQVLLHAVAIETVARQPIERRLRRRLRAANAVRVAALLAVAAAVIVDKEVVALPGWAVYAVYIGVPVAAGASDLEAIQKCVNLSGEIGWDDSASEEWLTKAAWIAIFVGAIVSLLPILGWILGPLLWFGGLALCFRALERFGRGARTLLPAAAAGDGVLAARAEGCSA